MNKKFRAGIFTAALGVLALLGLGFLQHRWFGDPEQPGRVWQHQQAADALLTLGPDRVPSDFLVDGSFVSHLPLVVIDTFGQEIVNYKHYDAGTDSFVEQVGIDPYVEMEISFVDNEDHVNSLSDVPTARSRGRIKVRGNSSASSSIPKYQYLLKLETEAGDKNNLAVLGMDPSDTWVLNGTVKDGSMLRNYLGYNLGGELDPCAPDIRMCEVVLRQGSRYEYLGLFGLVEKVEQGAGRVDIPEVSQPIAASDQSYILKRDRRDVEGYSMAVWSTVHGTGNNWINLEYPSPEKITGEYWDYIQSDIRKVEAALYADDWESFLEYRDLLDVDSFVDYFIVNELLLNYDAGTNSTYLYKTAEGKIAIGPVWDFDDAMDNNDQDTLTDYKAIVFPSEPWFDGLVRDPDFNQKVEARYHALREGVFSDAQLERRIDEAAAFIEKPVQRDSSRWSSLFERALGTVYDPSAGLRVDRDRDTWAENVQKVKDAVLLHAEYMDQNLAQDLAAFQSYEPVRLPLGGWLLIAAFFVSVILVQRVRKGG